MPTSSIKKTMSKVECDNCGIVLNYDPSKLPQGRVEGKCKKCGHKITINNHLNKPSKKSTSIKVKIKLCPKCKSQIQNDAKECNSCGIVFSKYEKNQEEKAEININNKQKLRRTKKENLEELSNGMEGLQLTTKILRGFRQAIDIYYLFPVWKKFFFGFMASVWLVCFFFYSYKMVVNSFSLTMVFTFIFSLIGLLLALVILPFLFLSFLERVQKNYPKDSFIYKLLGFKGVIQRLDFFIYTLIIQSLFFITILLAAMAPSFFMLIAVTLSESIGFLIGSIIFKLLIPIVFCFILFLLFGNILITLKRITDINKSRWLALMLLVPIVGFIFQFALYFIPSVTKGNDITSNNKSYKICPECAESVLSSAKKCRFCGYQFNSVSSQ